MPILLTMHLVPNSHLPGYHIASQTVFRTPGTSAEAAPFMYTVHYYASRGLCSMVHPFDQGSVLEKGRAMPVRLGMMVTWILAPSCPDREFVKTMDERCPSSDFATARGSKSESLCLSCLLNPQHPLSRLPLHPQDRLSS